jgi:hypothetical protein
MPSGASLTLNLGVDAMDLGAKRAQETGVCSLRSWLFALSGISDPNQPMAIVVNNECGNSR